MFVLDTNVVSELRKATAGKADRHVAAWAAGVPADALFVSAITILELETGVLLVQRRDPDQGALLRAWLDQRVLPAFAGRVLPVDTAVAQRCAALHVPDPRSERDALIGQHRREYLALALLVTALNYVPPLFLITPVLSALAFGHFSLSALRQLRAQREGQQQRIADRDPPPPRAIR